MQARHHSNSGKEDWLPGFWLIGFIALLLSACVTVEPDEGPNPAASKINVQLGMGYLQQNSLVLANEKLTKALRQDPESAAAHNAYAILQDRLLQTDKAEEHYRIATELDPANSQAANNYGAFLCRNNREAESEVYFLQAIENPLYKTPEFAYTNAALCLLAINEVDRARIYLRRALAARNDFPIAVVTMAGQYFDDQNFEMASRYIDRYHLVASATAQSLWLAIRIELELGNTSAAEEHAFSLAQRFPDSNEYQSWLGLN